MQEEVEPLAPLEQEDLNSRAAPIAPRDRAIPDYVFEEKHTTVAAKQWGENTKKRKVIERSLDADRDGNPEEIRYFDAKNGTYLRRESDRNYDGNIDTWQSYSEGSLIRRELDGNDDGSVDTWEYFQAGRMVERKVDRNHDGQVDVTLHYAGDSLISEAHDTNYDGSVDRTIRYKDRRRILAEEDLDHNGTTDTWTQFGLFNDDEIVTRIERDQLGSGKANTFEIYQQAGGKTFLVRREEDRDGDGNIDITSIYENGKLVRKEVTNPDLI